ncbi:MAG: DUF2335 domain-containing protein, partial [Armatimonadota bacterium]
IIPHKKEDKNKEEDPVVIPREVANGNDEKGVISRTVSYAESFSGPLPHPKIFAQYKSVMSDAPKRIFRMAELQQEHRFGLENMVIKSDINRANMGLWLGFILFLSFGIGAMVLLAIGKDIQGYSLLATSILGGAINFIRVGRERTKETQNEVKKKPKKKSTTAVKATEKRKKKSS